MPPKPFDIIIAGAGFAGSLTALALQQCGFHVCLIEKGKHPRFAIGESSTPIADMILRSLSQKYNLPWLSDFSRYGSWQTAHPEIVCGIKRGFSYYKHHPGTEFTTDENHGNELLVAASVSDALSDTNWLREAFDDFLISKVKESGIEYWDETGILSAERENSRWTFEVEKGGETQQTSSSFFIDASGSNTLLHNLFGVSSSANDFLTHSFAVFSHLENLPLWNEILRKKRISTADYPFNPDHSALHHILDEGWAWSLRFNNGRTSWGFALDSSHSQCEQLSAEQIWLEIRRKYPDMDLILGQSFLSEKPGQILKSGRLQRKLNKGFGDGWVAMPHTIGFVDPLFSTGIAYSLSGIERIVEMLCEHRDFQNTLYTRLEEYEMAVYKELSLIDILVAGCYKTMRHFPMFQTWCMVYFTFVITYEQKRLHHLPTPYFLEANHTELLSLARQSFKELLALTSQEQISPAETEAFTERVRKRIAPFNTAGLLNPAARNLYHHTAADLS